MDSRPRGRSPGPAPVALIVSVLLLAVVGGAVFYMYRAGARGPSDAPQPLGAPLGDVRSPAPPQLQATDPGAGLTISKDDPNAAAPPTLAPAPENPVAAPTPAAAAPPSTPAKDAEAAKPAARPAAAAKTDDQSDAIGGLIAGAAKTKLAAAPVTLASAAAGSVAVQIGAFSSERLADQEWSKAAAVAPGPMAGKGKRVVPVAKDGDTLYRTSITGFASREQAQSLCDRLTAAGGNCFVR